MSTTPRSNETTSLSTVIKQLGLAVSPAEIQSEARAAASAPDATASSLARSIARKIGQPATGVVDDARPAAGSANPASAIVDALVQDGFLRFEGRRPVLNARIQSPHGTDRS